MKVLTDNKYYGQIADVIREQNGTSNTYKPPQMVNALKNLFYEEVEGVPPITFQGIGENLLDYRIDGASGGVGDRTGNLFDGSWENKFIATYGNIGYSTNRVLSSYVTVIPNQTYSVKSNMRIRAVHSYNDTTHTQALIDNAAGLDGATFTIPADSNSIRISLKKANDGDFTPDDIDWCMLNIGSQPLPYEPYGYKVPVVVSGKNLLNNVSSTVTFQGVKFTINEDKSITLDGTASNNAWLTLQSNNVLDVGQYILTGAVNNTILRYQKNSTGYAYDDTGAGRNINITQKTTSGLISLKIKENVFYDNITIYPMIRLASIEDDTYEPYIEPTTTNIYLDEPIEENESISLSDTNVNIPTIRGTNVLSIDTTVQPSNVYVKSRHESSYETAMRERYEEAQAQLDALESEGE